MDFHCFSEAQPPSLLSLLGVEGSSLPDVLEVKDETVLPMLKTNPDSEQSA